VAAANLAVQCSGPAYWGPAAAAAALPSQLNANQVLKISQKNINMQMNF
jgi:hypothetical protein